MSERLVHQPERPVQQFLAALSRETEPHLPGVHRFTWNPQALGGFDAPAVDGLKDLTQRKEWKKEDTVRMAGQLTELDGQVILARTFLPDPTKSLVDHETVALRVDMSQEACRAILEKTGKLPYIAMDVTLKPISDTSENVTVLDSTIKKIHGIEEPYRHQGKYDFFQNRDAKSENSQLIPETALVQGEVLVGILPTHMAKLQGYIDHKKPHPDESAIRGQILCQPDPNKPDVSILLTQPPNGISIMDILQDEGFFAFPEDAMQARVWKKTHPRTGDDIYDISAIELQKESRYRLAWREEKQHRIDKLLQQMDATTQPAEMRNFIGSFLAERLYPSGGDSINFAMHPDDMTKIQPYLAKLSDAEQLFLQEFTPDQATLKDMVRASDNYGRNLLELTREELRNLICDQKDGKQCYERMSLYRLAAEALPLEDLERIAQTVLQPGIVEKQSDNEMSWLSRYFDKLAEMTPESMDLMEVALESTLDAIGPKRKIISDYSKCLNSLVTNPDDPLWKRKNALTKKIGKAVRQEIKQSPDDYQKYLLGKVLDDVNPPITQWKKRAIIAGGLAAAGATTAIYLYEKRIRGNKKETS